MRKSGLTRRRAIWLAAGSAGVVAAGGPLELTVADEAGVAVPARVRVRDARGKDHVPEGAVVVPIGPDKWFVTSGRQELARPDGEFEIRVERGPEYVPVRRTVPAAGSSVEIRLNRWIDMRKRGYRSGENHLHVPARDLPAMLTAEDLDFGSSLYWWNGPDLDHPGPGGAVREMRFGGASAMASVFDAELEYPWGAAYLLGVARPLETVSHRGRANWAYLAEARKLGGLVCYQGGWSREVLVDALLGLVDVVNVCNNNFHRHKFQPRSRYSNLLEVDGFPVYPDTPEGMLRMNTDTYYRLLNCGLRLAAGAGSATGVKSSPAGYNRCYVRMDDRSLKNYLEGWRAGRNFVTNSPMVFLTVGEDAEPGETVRLPKSGGRLRLRASAISEQPLRTLEVVANGEVVARSAVDRDAREAALDVEWECGESAWIAARATEEDLLLTDEELAAHDRDREGARLSARERGCRLRFGHSSPVYAQVNGRAVRVGKSVREARMMLDAFTRFARETASDEYREEILERVAEAQGKLG